MTVLEKSWARSCFSSVLGVKVTVSWRARSAYPTGSHCPLELIWPGSPLFFQIPHSLLSLELQTHSCRRSLGLILNFAQTLFLQLLSWLCPPQLLQQFFFFQMACSQGGPSGSPYLTLRWHSFPEIPHASLCSTFFWEVILISESSVFLVCLSLC